MRRMSIDLPPASSRVLTQALADLPQRQPGTAGPAAQPATALVADAPTATPASSLLDLSPQARLASAASQSAALAQTAALAAGAPLSSWPTSGVNAPTQALVNTLLQQFQGSPTPLQASSVQAWPATLLPQLQADAADAPGQPLAEGLPPLQTWLVQQGSLPTRDGPRSYTMSLYVPAAWLGQQNAASSVAMAAARPTAPALPAALTQLAQLAATQPSGVFALVLQAGSERTSALLHIEFAPQQHAAVYGKPVFNPALDPWQQQAVLQASDERPDLTERPQHGPLCDKPHCPYAGAAACPQPFCPALHLVGAVTGPTALPG